MTIMDAINRIDLLKPNGYAQVEKIRWLSTLDERILNDIILTHDGSEKVSYYEVADDNGEPVVFATYEDALKYATVKEKKLVTTGAWYTDSWDSSIAMDTEDAANAANGMYFIYKSHNNPKQSSAYFTEKRLNEVIAKYAKAAIGDFSFKGYDENTATNKELIAPAPYDTMYLYWLEAQVDYWNGEYGKYNNSMAMFYTAYKEYNNHYNRTHMPKGKKFKFF